MTITLRVRLGLGAVLVAALVSAPPVTAQSAGQTLRLGYLSGRESLTPGFAIAFREFGLRELEWTEGANLIVERRSAGNQPALLRQFAADLAQNRVDVIVAEGLLAARAAKEATRSIPVVFAIAGDPVAAGLVDSLGRPGGNVTGITTLSTELTAKRLQFVREIAPGTSRVGVLWNAANLESEDEWRQTRAAAERIGMTLTPLAIRSGPDVVQVIETAARQRVGAIVVLVDGLTFAAGADIVDLLTRRRIAAIYGARFFLGGEVSRQPGGVTGLMSFAPVLTDLARTAASYIDRIARGARPADLPVQQPASFELAVNVKAARAIGLTIPPALLLRADVVME